MFPDSGSTKTARNRAIPAAPPIPGLERAFANNADIVNTLRSRYYLCHGFIDDECLTETMRIQVANLRILLPEVLVQGPASAEEGEICELAPTADTATPQAVSSEPV